MTTVTRADFFAPSIAKRLAYVGVVAYLVYAAATLGLSLDRVEKGIGYGHRLRWMQNPRSADCRGSS